MHNKLHNLLSFFCIVLNNGLDSTLGSFSQAGVSTIDADAVVDGFVQTSVFKEPYHSFSTLSIAFGDTIFHLSDGRSVIVFPSFNCLQDRVCVSS